jgi:type IV pilus assembly protein PilA
MSEERPSTPPPPPPLEVAPPPYPAHQPPQRKRLPTWFWVAIVGGAFVLLVPVALIIISIAVPQMFKVGKVANQTSAIQTIRTIGRAELNYNLTYPANGFACSLAALGGDPKSGAPSAQAAQLIDPTLAATGQKNGYTFTVSGCTKVNVDNHDTNTAYQLTAIPIAVGKTGDNSYCSDESNFVKVDPTGGTNCTQPIQ